LSIARSRPQRYTPKNADVYLWGLDLAIDKVIRGIFAYFGAR